MAIEINIVHEATNELTEALNQLLPQFSPTHTQLKQETLRQLLASPNCKLFVAMKLDSCRSPVLGTVSLITFPVLTGIRARIEDLVVDKAVRGQGVGTALINRALTQARNCHATSVDLTSRPIRSQANQLYRHMGFSQRDTHVYRYDLTELQETS